MTGPHESHTIRDRFMRTYNGMKNVMTPHIVEYGRSGDYLYEISTGRGIYGEPIFGVTVLDKRGDKRGDKNKLFASEEAAFKYARNL